MSSINTDPNKELDRILEQDHTQTRDISFCQTDDDIQNLPHAASVVPNFCEYLALLQERVASGGQKIGFTELYYHQTHANTHLLLVVGEVGRPRDKKLSVSVANCHATGEVGFHYRPFNTGSIFPYSDSSFPQTMLQVVGKVSGFLMEEGFLPPDRHDPVSVVASRSRLAAD